MRDWINIINEAMLNEGRDAPLYHGTHFGAALQIISENRIDATVIHDIPLAVPLATKGVYKNIYSENGVSLSRLSILLAGPVLFVIDQQKLSQTKKLYPIDYWVSSGGSRRPKSNNKYEAEEFLVGPLYPLDKYLLAIETTKEAIENFKRNYKNTDLTPLLEHPKFKIVNSY
jgi:hypothetical protein